MTEWIYCPQCGASLQANTRDPDRPLACPSGHFVKYDNPLPSTIGVIERDGRFLLLKRARAPREGSWDAVGGFINGSETPEACLIREAREEIGLSVRPRRLIGAFPSIYGESGLKTLGVAFECDIEPGEIQLSDENSDYEWFPPEKLPELAFPDVASAFSCALQCLS